MEHTGKVVLVGAGPGDAGLLTLKGKECLQKADVVVYDRLISPRILECAPAEAERIYVGKEQGHHPVPQEKINAVLADKAKEGKLVVRLKGGDPFVFGRGGEELELLQKEGIPFEVVPGITSAVAALCYAGIPATHRGFASSLHIITGHAKAGASLDIDFDALAKVGGTLVFLMSVSVMGDIVEGLGAAGMPAGTPAAVVENGTLPQQRRVTGTLETIEELARGQAVESPAILVVGGVCGLAETLDWFGHLPLKGKTVLVTRPKARAGTLCDKLHALGADVVPFSCIETRRIAPNENAEKALRNIKDYGWLALTSPEGVDALFQLLCGMGLDARALGGVQVAAIGAGTAKELAGHGIVADFVPQHYDAAHLGAGLAQRAAGGQKVLLMRAEAGTPELLEILQSHNVPYDDIATYQTEHVCENSAAAHQLLAAGKVGYITFTSASTVAGFSACVPDAAKYPFKAVCIGNATMAAAQKQGYKTIVAQNATIDAMVDAIVQEEKQ